MSLQRTSSGQVEESLLATLDDIDQQFQEARLVSFYLFQRLRGDDVAVGSAKEEEKGLLPSVCRIMDDCLDKLGQLPESSEKRRIYQHLERLRELEESSISARHFVEHVLASCSEHLTRLRDRNRMVHQRNQESRELQALRQQLQGVQELVQLGAMQLEQREQEQRHERERSKLAPALTAKDQLPESDSYFTQCFDEDAAAALQARALAHFQAFQFQKIPVPTAVKTVSDAEAFVERGLHFVERQFCHAVEESLKLFEACSSRAQKHHDDTSEKFDGLSRGETASRRKTRCNLWGLDARAKKMGRAVSFLRSFKVDPVVDPDLLADLPPPSSSPDHPVLQLGTNAANAPDGWEGFARDGACGLDPHRFGLK